MKKNRVRAYLKTFNHEMRRIKGEAATSLLKDLQELLDSEKLLNAAAPHLVRLESYKKHIQELSDCILRLINEIMIPYIKDFDEKSISKIKISIRETFQTLAQNSENIEKTYGAMMGKKYNAPMAIGMVDREYRLNLDNFLQKIESAIERGNLKETIEKENKTKERLTDLKWKIFTHVITFIIGAVLGFLYHKFIVN